MIAAGANPLELAEALGHSDSTADPTLVRKRDYHLDPGSMRERTAALDRHLPAVASQLVRDEKPRSSQLPREMPPTETGATGLEPATSGVTGQFTEGPHRRRPMRDPSHHKHFEAVP